MAAPTAILTFGTYPLLPKAPNTGGLVINEAYLLIDAFNFISSRTKKTRETIAALYTTAVRYVNPTAKASVSGAVSDATVLTRSPGTTAAANVNLGATIAGCDTSVGALIYEDIKLDSSVGDGETKMSFEVVWHPFAT
jgi:uncharacterized Rossmann fold enzyme